MPDPDAPPAWLDAATLHAMVAARDRHLVGGGDARAAAREIAWAHHPAWPLGMIEDAVAWVVPEPAAKARPARSVGLEADDRPGLTPSPTPASVSAETSKRD